MTTSNKLAHFRIPRRSEIVMALPTGKKGKADPKPYIERALDDDDVIAAIEVFKTNGGGNTGHWRVADIRAMDVILAHDKKKGNGIMATGMTEAEILAQVNVVLRRRYEMIDHKIIGLSSKWMLANKPTAEAPAAE